jgi:hypothetical protein
MMTLLLTLILVVAYVAAAIYATRRVGESRDLERCQKVILIGVAWVCPFLGSALVWSASRSGLLGDLPRFNHDPTIQSEMNEVAESLSASSGTSSGGADSE